MNVIFWMESETKEKISAEANSEAEGHSKSAIAGEKIANKAFTTKCLGKVKLIMLKKSK